MMIETINCRDCRGTGKSRNGPDLHCEYCNGTGKVPTYAARQQAIRDAQAVGRAESAQMRQSTLTQPAPETGEWRVSVVVPNEVGDAEGKVVCSAYNEAAAAQIVSDHNSVPRLVKCVQDLLGVITHLQDQNAVTWPDEKEKIRWAESILALTTLRREG